MLTIIVSAFAALGITALLFLLYSSAMRPIAPGSSRIFTVYIPEGDPENLEQTIKNLLWWKDNACPDMSLVVLTQNAGEQATGILEKMTCDRPDIVLAQDAQDIL